jgi:hypothetical protein
MLVHIALFKICQPVQFERFVNCASVVSLANLAAPGSTRMDFFATILISTSLSYGLLIYELD